MLYITLSYERTYSLAKWRPYFI